jgi:O-antigen/teichoic acid export membrane protein
MLWSPILKGIMQGTQNFLWLGWSAVFNSAGRLAGTAIVVMVLAGGAAGIMAGALAGMAAAFGVVLWQSWHVLKEPGAPFDAGAWLASVLPLTAGFGASQFLFSADLFVVQAYLGQNGDAAPYVFGGTLARAIVSFTGPLAAVMFPRLVHSAARSQKTNVLRLTLVGTLFLSAAAAATLILTAPLLIKLGSTRSNLSIVPLIPLFAWSMVPLAVGNVLLNSLMAHSRFKVIPILLLVSAGYWIALLCNHSTFKSVIQTFGAFNFLFLAVCFCFDWRLKGNTDSKALPGF